MWCLLQGKYQWEALDYFKHGPYCLRYWKAKSYTWTQTGKRSMKRQVLSCMLTTWTHLFVHLVPNVLLRGRWWCVLGKDCYAEAPDWKQYLSHHSQILTAPKPGQAQRGVHEALVPIPLARPQNSPQLPALLTSAQPLQTSHYQRQTLGRAGLLGTCTPKIPAAQSSCSHLGEPLPWRATMHPCNDWEERRGTKWLGIR